MRSTWILFLDLLALDICLLLLAVGFMVGNEGVLTAGYAFGVLVCGLSCEFLSSPLCSFLGTWWFDGVGELC